MSDKPKYMKLSEFRDLGFLQEVNRRLLHPAGLALTFKKNAQDEIVFDGIMDYRDDPEGILFSQGTIDRNKIETVNQIIANHLPGRLRFMGTAVQKDTTLVAKEKT